MLTKQLFRDGLGLTISPLTTAIYVPIETNNVFFNVVTKSDFLLFFVIFNLFLTNTISNTTTDCRYFVHLSPIREPKIY